MLISEAMVMLAPYGVERIERVPNDSCQVWKVTQNGAKYLYAAELDRVVWALTAANARSVSVLGLFNGWEG